MLTDCTTGPEAGRECVHPSRMITLAETIRYWNGYGAGDEARTRYLHLGKVALYRMSYARICLELNFNFKQCCLIGASGRNRTNDTRIFSPLLYLLSYRGILSRILCSTAP